jgi:hypothetical protein
MRPIFFDVMEFLQPLREQLAPTLDRVELSLQLEGLRLVLPLEVVVLRPE